MIQFESPEAITFLTMTFFSQSCERPKLELKERIYWTYIYHPAKKTHQIDANAAPYLLVMKVGNCLPTGSKYQLKK